MATYDIRDRSIEECEASLTKISSKGWEERANRLAVEQARRDYGEEALQAEAAGLATPTPQQMRHALVELLDLLLDAPEQVQIRFKTIPEARLRALSAEARSNLDRSSLKWITGDLVEAAGAQLRALDRHLLSSTEIRGRPTDPNRDYYCPSSRAHVIPRFAAREPQPHQVTTLTARRRGLIWHRIIPEKIGDFAIDLQWQPDLSLSFRRPSPPRAHHVSLRHESYPSTRSSH